MARTHRRAVRARKRFNRIRRWYNRTAEINALSYSSDPKLVHVVWGRRRARFIQAGTLRVFHSDDANVDKIRERNQPHVCRRVRH